MSKLQPPEKSHSTFPSKSDAYWKLRSCQGLHFWKFGWRSPPPPQASTQATSESIKCKHWICWNISSYFMFQVIFTFSDGILIKQIIVSFTPFYWWGKQIFERMLPWGMSNFFLPRAWWQKLGDAFGVGRGMSENVSNQCIF